MPLIKTLSQALKMDKERFQVPKSVQQAVPIRRIWPDGIFQVGNKYSKSFRFKRMKMTYVAYIGILFSMIISSVQLLGRVQDATFEQLASMFTYNNVQCFHTDSGRSMLCAP